MSEVSDRYVRIADGFTARVLGVPAGGWANPSPCSEWTAREVVGHVVAVHRSIVSGLDASVPPAPVDEADLVGAWRAATGDVLAVLADGARSSAPASGRFSSMSMEALIGRLLCNDTLVHTWDLARATGQDEELDAAGVTIAFDGIRPADDAIRGAGGFGPKIEPPAGAGEQTRFLCFLGRRVE